MNSYDNCPFVPISNDLSRQSKKHSLTLPLGRISIANSEAEGSAYLHAAIDAAARAVDELGAG